MKMNIRACIKCKEYITIFEDNPHSKDREKQFNNTHLLHPLITTTEILENYINVNKKHDRKGNIYN